ncbi:hypothetical protein AB0D27_45410 [Streptomyces sp. NPDC048415]|uniref:hypothetical protein n=1 Tax=Streptomyces sp. NPDC048415 TaxID=3154822 RepID=UPI0034266F2F
MSLLELQHAVRDRLLLIAFVIQGPAWPVTTAGPLTDSPPPGPRQRLRAGASQDKEGYITKPDATVTYAAGTTLYGMQESTHCSKHGDSGEPLLHGSTALGIVSGGNYLEEPCGDSDAQSDRYTYTTRIQDVLNERGLHVY